MRDEVEMPSQQATSLTSTPNKVVKEKSNIKD